MNHNFSDQPKGGFNDHVETHHPGTGSREYPPYRAAAVSIPLESATAEDYRDTPDYNMIQDCGVYITGIFTGKLGLEGNTLTRYFIGLGEEPAAHEFKEFLFKFIQNTRK